MTATSAALRERLKMHRLYNFIKDQWSDVKEQLKGKDFYSNDFSNELFYKMAGISKDKWQDLKLVNADAILDTQVIHSLLKSPMLISTKLATASWSGQPAKYTTVTRKVTEAFKQNIFSWDSDDFQWSIKDSDNLSSVWPLNHVLECKLNTGFAGANWYIYKYSRYGIQRMILTIAESVDEYGLYKAYILRRWRSGHELKVEDIIFEGNVFTDRNSKTVLVLNDNSQKYAHIILFTDKLERNINLEMCVGHFTYFSTTPGVGKYLTKSIVALLTKEETLEVKTIATPKQCIINGEELILRYLSSRQKNRLTSIGDTIYSVKGLKQWFDANAARSDNKMNTVIESYKGNYYVFYVKKHPKTSNEDTNRLEFFQDKFMLSYNESGTSLEADYQHYGDPGESLEFSNLRLHSYTGQVNMKQHFMFGLLLSNEQDPLYLSMHVPLNLYSPNMECFIGSVTGERDNGMVMVSYTCVLVPFKLLQADQPSSIVKREKIKNFLESEVERGWSVIDPSMNKAFSFRIDDLISANN